jgi:hypothetical protein
MRMWMVDPAMLCTQHLLGEHVELHMFVGTIQKGVSIRGYLDKGLLEPNLIRERHSALVQELERRGAKHTSPLPDYSLPEMEYGFVDAESNYIELSHRCPNCRKRIYERKWLAEPVFRINLHGKLEL